MSSSCRCMNSGDLVSVRMSATVTVQTSSTLCICYSQRNTATDCRRIIPGLSLDNDGKVSSALQPKAIHPSHLLHFRRRKRSFSLSAALNETAEKVTAGDPSLEPKPVESLIRNELSVLDAYFNKLQGKVKLDVEASPSSEPKAKDAESTRELPTYNVEALSQEDLSVKTDLRRIELYLDKLSKGSNQPSTPAEVQKYERELETLMKEMAPSLELTPLQAVGDDQSESVADEPLSSAGSESSVVYVIAAINIAVYLFGLASPVDTAGMGTSTLPLLYGAKVNEFLLNGEWWRLITPIFLHSGFFHIALSSWALLFFGPQVERVFGPLAFCMIYFLGGLCGNICSFFFTPAATVGGTGPLFALFSAWVAYLWQNKRVLGEQSADYGIKATTLMGVLVLCLSCLLPTDEWIHVGAILPGILFGSFASPLLHVGADGIDPEVKNMDNREPSYAIFDTPSVLSLSVGFVLSTGLCFIIYNILVSYIENSELRDTLPF